MRDPPSDSAVAHKDIGVVDNLMVRPLNCALNSRSAIASPTVSASPAQRPGGGFNAGRIANLRVTVRLERSDGSLTSPAAGHNSGKCSRL